MKKKILPFRKRRKREEERKKKGRKKNKNKTTTTKNTFPPNLKTPKGRVEETLPKQESLA